MSTRLQLHEDYRIYFDLFIKIIFGVTTRPMLEHETDDMYNYFQLVIKCKLKFIIRINMK